MRANITVSPKTIEITLSPKNPDERLKLLNFLQMKIEAVILWDTPKNKPYGIARLKKTYAK